jgi:hypothetical protein
VNSDAYLDDYGYARGQITATWSPVTHDINGVAIEPDTYELYARVNQAMEPWRLIASSDETTATYSPLIVATTYAFKVRAVAQSTKGEFSDPVVVLIDDDTTPPPVPSTPALSTRLGVIEVGWDGLGQSGGGMSSDFEHVRVWMAATADGPFEVVDHLRAAGSALVTDQPYNTPRWFRLTSMDRRGNESAPSSSASIAAQPLVNSDLIGKILSGANIINGTVNAADAVIANTITGNLVQANTIDTPHLRANAITADKMSVGSVTAVALTADAINGKTITGSIVRSAATGQRFVLDSSTLDLRFYPAGNTNYSRFYALDGLYPGETTTIITSGTNQSASARAELQVAAGLVRLGIRDVSFSTRKGGGLDVAEAYGRFGYDDGFSSSQSYIHCNDSGRWYLRGRVWDTNTADPYDTVHAGSGTVPPDSGGVTIHYGPTMASNMGPVATIRDGAANPNFYWCEDLSSQTDFSFGWSKGGGVWSGKAFYWWSHRH